MHPEPKGIPLIHSPNPCNGDNPPSIGRYISAGPFCGSYSGLTWNAQGFFHSRPKDFSKRRDFFMRHLKGKDFGLVSELHGDPGMSAVFNEYLAKEGYTGFWHHFNRRRAGVGIVVSNDFLMKFSRKSPEWIPVAQGEVSCLRLFGKEGDLDLFSIYMPTGNQAREGNLRTARDTLRSKISMTLRPRTHALSILAGDFNYVTDPEDRFTKKTMSWSGGKDECEQLDWASRVEEVHGIHEIYQPMATHDCGLARSRLDRIYSNHHTGDQLDSKYGCACLDWAPHLSSHRPVTFFRCRQGGSKTASFITEDIVREKAWSHNVSLRYQDFLKGDPDKDDPLRKLVLLKRAIQDCSLRMMDEKRKHRQQEQCTLVDDKIGWTMKAVRAIEKGRRGVLLKCIGAYPLIGNLVNPYEENIGSSSGLLLLKDHAVKLHKEHLVEELRNIQQDEGRGGEHGVKTRRSQVQVKLNRLKPGNCCSVGAIKGSDGHIISDPKLMIAELRKYWKDIFSHSPCNDQLLRQWAGEEDSIPSWEGFRGGWVPCWKDMAKVIQIASKSAPGPDGIPYSAWKCLGELGVEVLLGAAICLSQGDMDQRLVAMECSEEGTSHSFNLGNMVFLPKKPAGCHPLFGEFFSPGDVRPLVIVNTDNRLIANAFRRQWEPILDSWISASQQGFLPGRSMASNIIGIDFEAQRASLSHERAGILLFDFRAAFPSVSQEFLHKMLEILNLPVEARWAVRNLYCHHKCNISFRDMCEEGFDIGAGIRQGCPLSPLLFAFIIDIALRRIQKALPTAKVKAFADDIAVVVQDVGEALPILNEIFRELAQVAGLSLNRQKCILIPLWPSSVDQVKRELVASFPDWADLQVAYSATYLGVEIGPESIACFWDRAIQKYEKRAQVWGRAGLGLQFAALAYSVYVLPVLSFLAQFKIPDEKVFRAEERALCAMVPGPYRWCLKSDLFALKEHYGQAKSFPCLEHMSIAARCRMLNFESLSIGGLKVKDKVDMVSRAMVNSTQSLIRQSGWATWFANGMLRDILSSVEQVEAAGLSVPALMEKAAGPKDEESPPQARAKVMRTNFQKTVRKELDLKFKLSKVTRMRFKLDRWGLAGLPGQTAERFLRLLVDLKEWLPPRVRAATLRTAFNGWCTKRRFQGSGPCLFQCGSFVQEDSLEHYAGCSVCVKFLRKRLHFQGCLDRGHLIVLGAHRGVSRADSLRLALWGYVLYRTFNHIRHREGHAIGNYELEGILEQYLRDATNGHEDACQFVSHCWNQDISLRAQTEEIEMLLDDWDFD